MSLNPVVPVENIDFVATRWIWPFAIEQRAKIDQYFAQQQRANPALWNGRVLLLRDLAVKDSTLRGSAFETDYASMLAGIAWGVIGDRVMACFGAAALVASDDAFVVGLMAPHTRNAGQIYFPSGSFDPDDLAGTHVDCVGNVKRELSEETGLLPEDVEYQSGWYAVFSSPHVPLMKIARVKERGSRLRDRIMANLAAQASPEFSDIHLVRGLSDLDARMPAWMTIFFNYVWR
jgi:8-oxo-dGTP pyrophosphatase MutT (NUDIX family)